MHTKGMWTAKRDNEVGECFVWVEGDDGDLICDIGTFPYSGIRTMVDARLAGIDISKSLESAVDMRDYKPKPCPMSEEEAEARANANLIAAAPRLLAALVELVMLKDRVKYNDPADYERRKGIAWDMAREAIRSVEGPL